MVRMKPTYWHYIYLHIEYITVIFRREWDTYLYNINANWQVKSGLLTMPLKSLS